jgi:type IV secretory pathway protease TraF
MKKTFWYRFTCVMLTGVFISISLSIFSKRFTIAIAQQECLPYRVFIVDKWVRPAKGDFALASGEHVPGYGRKVKMVKIVACEPGGKIEVKEADNRTPRIILVNGKEGTYTPKREVKLLCNGGIVLTAFERGSRGQLLPQLPVGQKIIDGYFLMGTHEASYDSRYFGGIPGDDILGRAYPLF